MGCRGCGCRPQVRRGRVRHKHHVHQRGEIDALKQITNFKIAQYGRDEFVSKEHPDQIDIDLARKGFEFAKHIILGKRYDVVILDEINVLLIGDKGYISEELKVYLRDYMGIELETPLRSNMKDDRDPAFVKQLMKVRRLVETVIGQLSAQFHIEKVRARDLWHLTSRTARKVLAHTVGVFLNRQLGRAPLQFEGLIVD